MTSQYVLFLFLSNSQIFRIGIFSGSGITTVGGLDDVGGFVNCASPPKYFDITEAVFKS